MLPGHFQSPQRDNSHSGGVPWSEVHDQSAMVMRTERTVTDWRTGLPKGFTRRDWVTSDRLHGNCWRGSRSSTCGCDVLQPCMPWAFDAQFARTHQQRAGWHRRNSECGKLVSSRFPRVSRYFFLNVGKQSNMPVIHCSPRCGLQTPRLVKEGQRRWNHHVSVVPEAAYSTLAEACLHDDEIGI